MADIITATIIAAPSIQAVERWSGVAVPTSIAIETILATIRILRVKSSRASIKRAQKPGGYFMYF